MVAVGDKRHSNARIRKVTDKTWELGFLGLDPSHWIREILLGGRAAVVTDSSAVTPQARLVLGYESSEKWADAETQYAITREKPTVIIHGGDEQMRHKARNYRQVPVVIRDNFNPFMKRRGIYFVPIGYSDEFVFAVKPLCEPRAKSVLWSFVGNRKHDRKKMLEGFYALGPHTALIKNSGALRDRVVSPSAVAETYQSSSFVLCPFGLHSPDTSRIMDALEAGAIPVTVSFRGIDYFKFAYGNHPFIVGSDWSDAVAKVRLLSENPEELASRQKACTRWYAGYVEALQHDLEIILQSGPASKLKSPQFAYQRDAKWSLHIILKFWLHFIWPPFYKEVRSVLAGLVTPGIVRRGTGAYRKVRTLLARSRSISPLERRDYVPSELPDEPRLEGTESIFDELPVTRFYGLSLRDNVLDARGFDTNVARGRVPAFFTNFDWVTGPEWGFANLEENPRPKSVFCHPEGLDALVAWLDRTYLPHLAGVVDSFFCEVLVLGGSDRWLRSMAPETMSRSKQLFSKIYIQANDGSDPDIRTFPIAVSQQYLNGREETLTHLLQDPPTKTNLLFASWGKAWPHLNEGIPDRSAAMDFVSSSPWLNLDYLPTDEYLQKLSISKYMLYPQGNGIQSPKGYEALLLGTIPIVTEHPAFRELSDRGMPLFIVNSWDEVSEGLLEDNYETFRAKVRDFSSVVRDHKSFYNFACGFSDTDRDRSERVAERSPQTRNR